MKTVATLLLPVQFIFASQNASQQLHSVQVRNLPKEWVVGVFVNMLQEESKTELDSLYYQAIEQKVKSEGLPNHIYQAMVDRMVLGEDRLMAGETTFDRSVNCPSGKCSIPIQLNHIWGYGCWCNFGTDLLEGSYHPVNAYDEVCRNLQQCLKCAVKDSYEGDYDCDPKSKSYNAEFSWNMGGEGANFDCSSQNAGDDCGTHLCSCETNLISQILDVHKTYKISNFLKEYNFKVNYTVKSYNQNQVYLYFNYKLR